MDQQKGGVGGDDDEVKVVMIDDIVLSDVCCGKPTTESLHGPKGARIRPRGCPRVPKKATSQIINYCHFTNVLEAVYVTVTSREGAFQREKLLIGAHRGSQSLLLHSL